MKLPFWKTKSKKKIITKIVVTPRVKDVMTKNVVSFNDDNTIGDVIGKLSSKGVSGAPILKNGKVVGIIHESNIIDWMNEKLKAASPVEFEKKMQEASKQKVSTIMSRNPITIGPNATLEDAVKKMYKHGVDRLPVVEKGKLVGIVARDDIIRGLNSAYLARMAGRVKTLVDKIVREIKSNPDGLSEEEISRRLDVDIDTVDKWAKILEDHGIIEIEYPVTGGKILKIKKD